MTGLEEKEIIQLVVAGNPTAFAQLVDRYKDMAVILAYNIVLDQQDAEEVAQDAFLRAFRYINSFDNKSRFSTWLYRIIVNLALDKRNSKRSKLFRQIKFFQTGSHNVKFSDDEGVFLSDRKKHIRQAMLRLSEKERLCITLYYLNELTVAEINRITGISESSIKVLLHRSRQRLFEHLHQYLNIELTDFIHEL